MITLGSLFDGLGGWQLAAVRYGVTPIWSSEIEPFCIALTKERFPNTIQLGDIQKIDGGKIQPVTILTMGSPCQDLSTAGTRNGLGGERSGLFYDGIRIIRSMRDATNGLYPKVIIFENVPGILTSGAGMDWRDVLASYTESNIPIPKSGRWANAGLVRGRFCHVGWIIKDAQFYGVPQRRARLFACICFGESRFCAEKILFKPDRLQGNFTQKQGPWKRVASNTEKSIATASRIEQQCETAIVKIRSGKGEGTAGKGALLSVDKSFTLGCGNDQTLFQETEDIYNVGDTDSIVKEETKMCDVYNGCVSDSCPTITTATGISNGSGPKLLECMETEEKFVDVRNSTESKINGTLQKMASNNLQSNNVVRTQYAVRRLMPIECERLMGLPDNWTLIRHKTCSDSARFRAIGNGMAQPVADWLVKRVVEELKNAEMETEPTDEKTV